MMSGTHDNEIALWILVINKSMTILGSGPGTVLEGCSGLRDAAIEIRGAADATIARLTVSAPDGGVRSRDSLGVDLSDNLVNDVNDNSGYGVRARGILRDPGALRLANRLSGNAQDDIRIEN